MRPSVGRSANIVALLPSGHYLCSVELPLPLFGALGIVLLHLAGVHPVETRMTDVLKKQFKILHIDFDF